MDSYYDGHGRWFLRNQGKNMHVLPFPRHFPGLLTVPFLAVMLAFPARAQTGSDSETLSTGTAGAQAEPNSTGGPTSSPATPKTGSDAATPTPESSSTAAQAKSKPVSTPGTKKTGSPVLINIDKTKQKMTVFIYGVKNMTGRYQLVDRNIQLHQELILLLL